MYKKYFKQRIIGLIMPSAFAITLVICYCIFAPSLLIYKIGRILYSMLDVQCSMFDIRFLINLAKSKFFSRLNRTLAASGLACV